MRHPLIPATVLGLLLAHALPAGACTVDIRPLAFGIVDLSRINRNQGEIRLLCETTTIVEVAISGTVSGNLRPLLGPQGRTIWYQIAADAGFRRPWGDGGAGGDPVRVAVNGGTRTTLVVYGVVPAQPGVPEGEYADQLVVTVTY